MSVLVITLYNVVMPFVFKLFKASLLFSVCSNIKNAIQFYLVRLLRILSTKKPHNINAIQIGNNFKNTFILIY